MLANMARGLTADGQPDPESKPYDRLRAARELRRLLNAALRASGFLTDATVRLSGPPGGPTVEVVQSAKGIFGQALSTAEQMLRRSLMQPSDGNPTAVIRCQLPEDTHEQPTPTSSASVSVSEAEAETASASASGAGAASENSRSEAEAEGGVG